MNPVKCKRMSIEQVRHRFEFTSKTVLEDRIKQTGLCVSDASLPLLFALYHVIQLLQYS